MEILMVNAWILFILVNFLNVFLLRKRASPYIAQHPEKEKGYRTIFKNFLVYGSVPWIVMGTGIVSGHTKSVFDYFQPSQMNPFVLIFHFSIIMIWIMVVRFVFFRNGAKILKDHPGIIRTNTFGNVNDNPSENLFKLIVIIGIAGGMAAMILMWTVAIPFPK